MWIRIAVHFIVRFFVACVAVVNNIVVLSDSRRSWNRLDGRGAIRSSPAAGDGSGRSPRHDSASREIASRRIPRVGMDLLQIESSWHIAAVVVLLSAAGLNHVAESS